MNLFLHFYGCINNLNFCKNRIKIYISIKNPHKLYFFERKAGHEETLGGPPLARVFETPAFRECINIHHFVFKKSLFVDKTVDIKITYNNKWPPLF